MRLATVLALLVLFGGLAVFAVFGVGLLGQAGTLEEAWVSETARDNQVNHHAVGVGPTGTVVVAPVAADPGSDATVTETACALVRLAPSNGSVRWRYGIAPPVCFTHAVTEPAIADLDGDGRLAVVSSTTENALVAVDATTGRESFRVPLDSYGYGRPTVADLRPAPGREIVTSDIDGNVLLARAGGTAGWRVSLSDTFGRPVSVWDAPAVSDVDGDGTREITIGTNAGPAVVSPNGTVEWFAETGASDLVVAAADDDPPQELLTVAGTTISAIDGRTKEVEWERSVSELPRIRATADGDGDGTDELYVGLSNGTVLSMDVESGALEWSTTVSTAETPVVTAPVLADLDGAGPPEVVVATRDGTVAVLDADGGAELAASRRSVPVWTFPTPADLDDDGDEELLVRYGDGRVVALDYAG